MLGFKLISTGQDYQVEDLKIDVRELDLLLGEGGSISSLKLFDANVTGYFLAPPRIEILSQGNSAFVEPILEANRSASDFGTIKNFSIPYRGLNYSYDHFSILVIPVIRNIGYGEPGEFRFGQIAFDADIGPIYEIGLSRPGYGYAVSPVLEFQHLMVIGAHI